MDPEQVKQLLTQLRGKATGPGAKKEEGFEFATGRSEGFQLQQDMLKDILSTIGPEAALLFAQAHRKNLNDARLSGGLGEVNADQREQGYINELMQQQSAGRDLGIQSGKLDLAAKKQALRKGAISQAGGGKGEARGSVYQGQNPRDREAAMRAKEISRQLLEEQLASLRSQRESFENKSQDQDRTRDSIIPQLLRLLQGVKRSNYF